MSGEALKTGGVRVLPDHVANQIAAGEVVERPASVIKELVENSLDASARSVIVSIRNGGKSYMEVSDDGFGMSRDDSMMAFERHATSKIREAEDLKAVATLGFRGEALPSIASVARVILSTTQPGATSGVEIVIEGGKLRDVRDGAPIKGTRIVARDLFFNLPARRKFLRSEDVESSHSQEAVIRQALGRPDVAFTFIKEGRPQFSLPAENGGGEGFARRVASLFGKDAASQLAPVNYSSGGMSVTGLVSKPGYTRAGREGQYVYINGRYVKDRLVNIALMEGYRSLMPRGRHPAIFLNLSIPPERVDVNAHPSKTEVRFADGSSVVNLIKSGILGALMSLRSGSAGIVEANGIETAPVETKSPAAWEFQKTGHPAPMARRPAFCEPPASFAQAPALEEENAAEPAIEPAPPLLKPLGEAPGARRRVIGQVFSTFMLVEEEGGRLLVFDQHTVHERILYEKFARKYREGKAEGQELLFPVEVEFSRTDACKMARHLESFKNLGFWFEELGGELFTLRSAPFILKDKDYRELALDLLEKFETSRCGSLSEVAVDAINVMACRAAVKAGQNLDKMEMDGLLKQLDECVLPYTCPHGRPVSMVVTRDDLYKGFLRK